MKTHLRWIVIVLAPGFVGCTPDGPSEFYRSALQAKSEFVDSLARVVDEQSAGEFLKTSGSLLEERTKEVVDALEKAKLDDAFYKLRRDNFDIKRTIDADHRERMIAGMRAYAAYCKNIVYTNVRMGRELQRIRMVGNLEMLNKAKSQMAANQPVQVSLEADCPNLHSVIRWNNKSGNLLRFIPSGTNKAEIDKLQSGIEAADLELILTVDPAVVISVPVPGIELPPLPRYPDWAIDVDNRAKLGLTGRR